MVLNLEGMHPTKQTLIQTTVDLLDHKKPAELTIEEVLATCHVSKGSLYHHFTDFPDLVELSLVLRFSEYVSQTVESLGDVLRGAKTKSEALAHFREVATRRPSPNSQALRFERIHLLSFGLTDTRVLGFLGREQARMTAAWEKLFVDSLERGWANPDLDPRAVAIFMQAHVIGQIVNDISPDKMDEKKWLELIVYLFEVTFFGSDD